MFPSTIRKQVHLLCDFFYHFATGKSNRPTPPTRQEWPIGIYIGAAPLRLHAPAGFTNPVLTRCEVPDVPAAFVAAPFVIHADSKWWLFVETNPQHQCDTLRLLFADELSRPWREHPMSPVVAGNRRIARPAGTVQVIDGSVIRLAQDCYPAYGTRVRAFVVSEVTTKVHRERESELGSILRPSGSGWNRSGVRHVELHKLDDDGWIACVDGVVINSPRA